MERLDYSVIIRTTGKAGEKYAALLRSIDALVPRPREVIVVLPEGYELPPERLGWETFYFSPKGMVIQRLYGIQVCKTPYALITDDDIAFGPDFVQQLYQPVKDGAYGLSAGPLLEILPPKGLQTLFWALGAAAIPTPNRNGRYTTIIPSTGYIYNRHIDLTHTRIYESQSAGWACFFADIERLRDIHMEDELWLDRLGYSAHDDQVMFYKAWLRGNKTAIVSTAAYQHLDGKASTHGRPLQVKRSMGFTRTVLWHRFFYHRASLPGKLWAVLCYGYRTLFQTATDLVRNCIGNRPFAETKAFLEGVSIALKWTKTDEYKCLAPVVEEHK